MTRIQRLLVANRGEIARRIIRTAAAMGISTVAVHADGDVRAPYVREADDAYALGGRTAAETYLDIWKLVDAARRSGADAVHPGYGFLSENAAFARAVLEAGLTWVGPSPEAIAAMGDKLAAKRLMAAAGVPCLPSVQVAADGSADGAHVGFPALVKAAAGGGGKGMRVVTDPQELAPAVAAARREAQAAFGDSTVFVERYLSGARHVEIQVLADTHGTVVHCFERDCSIQRRHQKVVEEAPSPVVGPALREKMGAAAVAAARTIGYTNAGTVEFLLTDSDEFFFLEMNTRLQVEHPVTEAIIGLDLVREQLRIAEGRPLSFSQADLRLEGWAIEARVYAEDPERQFLPATGTLHVWDPPADSGARIDSGVDSGSVVGVEFDPMLAKVIVHAPTRDEAAGRLARTLERTRISGVTTNRDFLVGVLRHPVFLAGEATTAFLERGDVARGRTIAPDAVATAAVVTAITQQHHRRMRAGVLSTLPSGWRNSVMPAERSIFRRGRDEVTVDYRGLRDGRFAVNVADEQFRVTVLDVTATTTTLDIDGRQVSATLTCVGKRWWVHGTAGDVVLDEVDRFPEPEVEEVAGGLVAPMPGRVVTLEVTVGDQVDAGAQLVVLEAMKMEHRVAAPHAGRVVDVHVEVGAQVAAGDLLVIVEARP